MMKCKDVQERIMQDHMTQEDKKHMSQCISCLTVYEKFQSLEKEMHALFEEKDFDQNLNKVIEYPRRSYKLLAIAMVLLVSVLVFNDKIVSFAEDIPLIKDLIDYFSEDDNVEILESEGVEFYDFTFQDGLYDLYIKDLLYTNESLTFKFALTHNDEIQNNYNWFIRFNEGGRSSQTMDHNKDPWYDVEFKIEDQLGESQLSFYITNGLDKITFKELNLGIKPIVTERLKLDHVIEFKDEVGKLIISEMAVGQTSMSINLKVETDVDINDFTYLSMYMLDEKGNRFMQNGIKTLSKNHYILSFTPSIHYFDSEELFLVMDNRRYYKVRSLSTEAVNLNGFSFDNKDYQSTINSERFTLRVEGDDLFILAEKPVADNRYPRLQLKINGQWQQFSTDPVIDDDFEVIKTCGDLNKLFNLKDKGLKIDDGKLLITKTLDAKREITFTKKMIMDFSDNHEFNLSDSRINAFLSETTFFKLTLGELEKVLEKDSEEIFKDLTDEDVEKYRNYLSLETPWQWSFDMTKEQMIDLKHNKVAYRGSDAKINYKKAKVNVRHLDLSQKYEVGTVSDVNWTDEQVKIKLKIKKD